MTVVQNMNITWEKMYLTGQHESIHVQVCRLFDSGLGRGVGLEGVNDWDSVRTIGFIIMLSAQFTVQYMIILDVTVYIFVVAGSPIKLISYRTFR